jgi:hypothetical protein
MNDETDNEELTPEQIEQALSPGALKAFIRRSNPGGRHPALTQKTLRRLLNALADGLTQRQACVAAGISEASLYKYKSSFPDIDALIETAREKSRQKALSVIKKAGEAGDWRAAESFLKLAFKSDYNPRQAHSGTTINTTVNTAVVCDEETLAKMIEHRKRNMATTPPAVTDRMSTPAEEVAATNGAVEAEILKDDAPTE